MTDRFEEAFETILGSVKTKISEVEKPEGADLGVRTADAPHAGARTTIESTTEDPSFEGASESDFTASPVDVDTFVKCAKGAYLVPNYVSDYLMKNLSLGEQSVFNRLYRLSRGFNRRTEPITVRHLAESCGLNAKLTANIIKSLASKRLLRIIYSNPFTKKVKFKLVLPKEVEQRIILCGVCHNLILEDEEWTYFPITKPEKGRSQAVVAHLECVDGKPLLEGRAVD
jgi:hypothetical protein